MADPSRANEVMVTQSAAAALGLHLGQTVTVAIDRGSAPARRLALKVVGIGLLNREVVQDQIAKFPTYIVGTPALARSVASDAKTRVSGRAAARRRSRTSRPSSGGGIRPSVTSRTSRSPPSSRRRPSSRIRPEALALGAFGAIAALAALFLGMQVIARQLSAREQDLVVMRAVGADPATTGLDGLLGIFGSIVVGSALAVGVALALSPLFPIGPVRAVYPDRG